MMTACLVGVPMLAMPIAAQAAPVDDIVINEIESDDDTGGGDWIELTNIGTDAVDVSGWRVFDNDPTRTSSIPAGTVIAPGDYFVIEEPTIDFGLGRADVVSLFLADGTTLVDSYGWTDHAATTYGRCADGLGPWQVTINGTKGAANDCVQSANCALFINEVESSGGTPGDWIELVNTTVHDVDASGLILSDSDPSHILTLPVGTLIAAGAYAAFDTEAAYGLGGADSAILYDTDGTTVIDSYSWLTHATATTYGRCPDPSGAFETTAVSTKGAANDCVAPVGADIRVNEVESNGGTPGDWIELFNPGAVAVDLSDWVVRDNDDTRFAAIPAGSSIAAGGFFVVEEALLGFGLGANDEARLFLPGGTTLVDSASWVAHATLTIGRCPDGTGAFAATTSSTKGASNVCDGTAPVLPPTVPVGDVWPGGATVAPADTNGYFGENLSGLSYEATPVGDILWAVKNGPGTLFKLTEVDSRWVPVADSGWTDGALLHYEDGTGEVDAEGVTLTADGASGGVFVASERNNDAGSVSRPSVLRYDVAAPGSGLSATMEWNLASDLPVIAPNSGLEGITWIGDEFLTANGLVDQATGAAYDPASYPDHGDGLFFVGVEANGMVYAYALNQLTGAFDRVTSFASGFTGIMELQFDAEREALWAVCDDTCKDATATFAIAMDGASVGNFVSQATFARPAGMANLNNEGFAFAPQSQCAGGTKRVIFSDDNGTDGTSLRTGTMACTMLTALPTDPTDPTNSGSTASNQGAGGQLAKTGADVAGGFAVAGSMLLAGLVLLMRRRLLA